MPRLHELPASKTENSGVDAHEALHCFPGGTGPPAKPRGLVAPGPYTGGVSGSDLGYWLMWLLGLGLLGLCMAVTWWGLFGDRARGRRRCPRFWYDLSH